MMFEFRIERLLPTAPGMADQINVLGREGWQIVAAVALQDGIPVILVFFARAVTGIKQS